MRHVLVVDNEPAICELVQLALEADGSCRVTCASSVDEAVAVLRQDRPDAAIIDAILPQSSGLQLASQILDLGVPVLIVTGEPATRERLESIGCPYLAKPFPINVLVAETNALLDEAVQRRAELAPLLPRLTARAAPLRIAIARLRERARRKRLRRSAKADIGG
ncbi:MAG TPA: response regulator [Stellaceae bacterium]|nr:response regulator [Stellaceae bacterium]